MQALTTEHGDAPLKILRCKSRGMFKASLLLIVMGAAVLAGYRIWPQTPLPDTARADKVVVWKGKRILELQKEGATLKRYRISLGRTPAGPKLREGDGRTPQGDYVIDNRNPGSRFHLALHISHPDANDRRQARQAGYAPGGAIMVHGMRNGYGWIGRLHLLVDWTDGCIAVTDSEIEEIWRAVPNGTTIEIRP